MKRILTILFLIVLTAVLGACGESKNDKLNQTSVPETNTLSKDGFLQKLHGDKQILTFNDRDYDLNSELNISKDELTKEQLGYLRNGIYAKYGYKFKMKMYADYFSKFDWYEPSKDNVDELLNDIDQKNIKLILELEKKLSLRSNTEDKIIDNNESFTFKINDKQKKLFVYKESLDELEGNNPVKIELKIDGSQINIVNAFNDGIDVYMTDFDVNDGKVDICVAQCGLDIGRTTSIYTYDGNKIEKYADIKHYGGKLLYDQNGKIYYWHSDSEKEEFDHCFDYKTKESYELKTKIQIE